MSKKKALLENNETLRKISLFYAKSNLVMVRLIQSKIDASNDFDFGAIDKFGMERNFTFQNTDDGFTIDADFKFRMLDKSKAALGMIDVRFRMYYESSEALDDETFATFDPLVTAEIWPYFREFIQSTGNRANWPTLFVPSFQSLG